MKTKNLKHRALAVLLVMVMVLPLAMLGANASWVGFGLSLTEWNPTSEASDIVVDVAYVGVSWTVSSDVYWLTVSPTSGSGMSSGTNVTINAEANESGAVREGIITFAVVNTATGRGLGDWTITVTQEGRGIIAVSAGTSHSLVLKSDGTVWAWGSNALGQLGNGTTSFSEGLVQVSGLRDVIAISAEGHNSLALKSDGTVWAWGTNSNGQLGDGTTEPSSIPVRVLDLDNVTDISVGPLHGLALRNDGTVWAWGYNRNGGLATGSSHLNVVRPARVLSLNGVEAISTGGRHSLALRDDGTVWAWGDNQFGQLGNGRTTSLAEGLVQVIGLNDVKAISAGNNHNLALRDDGTVWIWGENRSGQIDINDTLPRTSPVQVIDLYDVVDISTGMFHNLALRDDGTVWAWGANAFGRLGNGNTTPSSTPVQVSGLNGLEAISAGQTHSLVLRNDGTVWAWGANHQRQLGVPGDSQVPYSPVPVQSYTGT